MRGSGGEAFAHLALHHHEHARDGRNFIEHVAHERRGDVVGQVGHEHNGRGPDESLPVEAHGVGLDHGDARPVAQHLAQR